MDYSKTTDGRLSYFRRYYKANRDRILDAANKKYREKAIAKMYQQHFPELSQSQS